MPTFSPPQWGRVRVGVIQDTQIVIYLRMSRCNNYDLRTNVVIIGGGVIGTSIAYHLSGQSIDVILVEKDDIASGTSGACDGFILLQSKKPGPHLQMAMESARMMGRLSTELRRDIEYKKTGGMIIIKSHEDIPDMQKLVKQQRKFGLEVELLSDRQARELEPCLSPNIASATYSPMDAQVNPIALCLAFAESAKHRGVRILTGRKVTGIEVTNGKVEGVIISDETSREVHPRASSIRTNIVVNAAGVHAPVIGRMVGIDLPIVPRRGQILVTESLPPILNRVMICGEYLRSKFLPNGAKGLGVGLAMEQTRAGNILIGSTREFVGYDRSVTPEGMCAILKHAQSFVPAIREFNIIRAFAGLRPHTPDGLPIMGKVGNLEGFIVAAGHEGDGIALSPITGHLVAELIMNS